MNDQALTVLLIEDDPGDAKLIQELFSNVQSPSIHLECCDRLAPAVDRLARGGVDVILSDLALPDAKGLDIVKALHARAPRLPIVVLTGTFEDEELGVAALQAGAQDYLFKDEETRSEHRSSGQWLVRTLRYAIQRKQIEEQLRIANEQLMQKVNNVEWLNRIMMDREKRILELKQEIDKLRKQLQMLAAPPSVAPPSSDF